MSNCTHFSDDGILSYCGLTRPSSWMTVDGSCGEAYFERICGNCTSVQRQRELRERTRAAVDGAR